MPAAAAERQQRWSAVAAELLGELDSKPVVELDSKAVGVVDIVRHSLEVEGGMQYVTGNFSHL